MGKTNILFIVPPVIPIEDLESDDPRKHSITNVSISLGLLSISAYVEKHSDVAINILDLNVLVAYQQENAASREWDDFLQAGFRSLELENPPDLIGISAIFNSNAGYLDSISKTAKRLWPQAFITAGGALPTNMTSYVLDSAPALDAVVIGEGERPFLHLVQAEDRERFFETSPSWMTRKKISAGFKPEMDFIDDLDEIPFLKYDLIDFSQYQKLSPYHGQKNEANIAAAIMTTRGCPFRCSFCASHSVHGRKIRLHSSARVLADIRKLKEVYGVNILLFQDDNFIVNKSQALEILDGVAQEDMTIEFPNGLSVMHLDEELVDALKAAGLKMATLAVESGSERVLNEIIHKPYKKLSLVKDVVKLLRRKKLYIRGFLIIGFPGETKAEIDESVQFMKKVGFNWVAIYLASPLAGSELYRICKENNLLLTDDLKNSHYGKSNIRLDHSSPKEIEEKRYLTNLEVNFVENYDLKNGFPELALIGFQDVISRVPSHAFAYYYASKCYTEMGMDTLAENAMGKYFETIHSSRSWFEYANKFNLPV